MPAAQRSAIAVTARKLWRETRTCLDCATDYDAKTPSAKYCRACAESRRRDHYRRKNHGRTGYVKAIRALPILQLWERDGGRCHLCRMSVDRFLSGLHPGMASYDHLVPTSRGGSDDPANLALAHLRCNIQRGNHEL